MGYRRSSQFQDATGATITLTWQQLVDLGIKDAGTYQIGVKATNADGFSAQAFTTLTVIDVLPVVAVSALSTAVIGTPYQISFSASDPNNDRITQWTVNWGDGTAVQTFGAGTTSATHSYADPGTAQIVVGAIDAKMTSQVFSSPSTVTIGLGPVTVSAGGAYSIAEGGTLSLAAVSTVTC
ncbi:MAG: PKD domain-containing protein [Pseudomonadota bacterium]